MNFLSRDPLTGVKSKHTFIEKEEEIDKALKKRQITGFRIISPPYVRNDMNSVFLKPVTDGPTVENTITIYKI